MSFGPHGGEQAPPPFAPYHPDFFRTSNGDVVSHDPHLNSDGEALYRFLCSQAEIPPSFLLHCRGTHAESHTRLVPNTDDSQTHDHSHTESYTQTVTDFDFYIDISQHIIQQPTQWSVADSDPAYRGRMVREIETDQGTRKAMRAESNAFKTLQKHRTLQGLPPWPLTNYETMPELSDTNVLRSSKTVRQWADEYCASPKLLKEFSYDKVLYGWNIQQLECTIRSTINSTRYWGELHVGFIVNASKVYIRPDNKMSRMLSNKWLKFLSIILFIFPFVWLFKRFNSRGGGRWSVCGGAYALRRVMPLEPGDGMIRDSPPSYRVAGDPQAKGKQSCTQLHTETHKLLGLREAEWFRKWEKTIICSVLTRYQSTTPLFDVPLEPDQLVSY